MPGPSGDRAGHAETSEGVVRRYACLMATLVLDPPPAVLRALLERRRRDGLDRFDEVWGGVLHMIPAPSFEHARITSQLMVLLDGPARAAGLLAAMGGFNLGQSEHDYRVPDGGLHRPGATGVWLPTAALVVEVVSPGDETWNKLGFYGRQGVDEVLIVDPEKRTVEWLARAGEDYEPVARSGLIELDPDELAKRIEWP
jgi:Uma2 family endonuclease